jgi:hypothetical protein
MRRHPVLWIDRITIVEVNILLKTTYRFNIILIKISTSFFTKVEKSVLKFIWKHKRTQIDKAILTKKSISGGVTLPDFKLY